MNAAPVTNAARRSGVASMIKGLPIVPLVLVLTLFVVAIFANQIAPYSPIDGELRNALKPPAWAAGGSPDYPLGTDRIGRDVLSRLIFGARLSLEVSLAALLIAGGIGTILGLISGYFGRWIDVIVMRISDIGLSIPMILIAVVLAVVTGPSLKNVILIVALLLWPRYARQIRGETLAVKEQDFVALARVAGCSHMRIILRHIFPNVIPTLLVLLTLQVGYVIVLEASLSFLGAGIPPPAPSWGVMVSDGRGLIASDWWLPLFTGIAIMLAVLSLTMLGD